MYLARILPVPVGDEVVELSLDDLPADIDEYVTVLREERCSPPFWLKLAGECGARRRYEDCHAVLQAAIQTLSSTPPHGAASYRSQQNIAEEVAPFHAMLANLQLANGRSCPKIIIRDAKYQNLLASNPSLEGKDRWQQAAAGHNSAIVLTPPMSAKMNGSARSQPPTLRSSVLLGRGIFLTVTGKTDEALRAFEQVLQKQHRNPIALLGKACCLLRKHAYAVALRLYQEVLRISIAQAALAATESAIVGPDGELVESQASRWLGPDPRVGIGLCLHGLGRTADAQRAWSRAITVNPANAAPHLLLGLSKMNAAKQHADLDASLLAAHKDIAESAVRATLYREGLAHIEAAWKRDNKNAVAAAALAEHICSRALATSANDKARAAKEYERALKLAEHAIQYADNRAAVNQAWLLFARTAHLYSFLDEASTGAIELRTLAQRFYTRTADDLARSSAGDSSSLAPGHALAVLGLTQLQVSRGESLGAINTIETIMARPVSVSSSCLELSLLTASLRASSHPGATAAERMADRQKARVIMERTIRSISACKLISSANDNGSSDLDAVEETIKSAVSVGDREADISGAIAIARTPLAHEKLGTEALRMIARLAEDELVHVQHADLFINTAGGPRAFARAALAYVSALRAHQELENNSGQDREAGSLADAEREALGVRLRANLGAVLALEGIDGPPESVFLSTAVSQLQRALQTAGKASSTASLDGEKTVILFNVGRVLEALDNLDDAQKAYDTVLATHPEYVDAKVRLAMLIVSRPEAKGSREATQLGNTLLKEAMASDPTDLDARSAYACFLAGDLPASPSPPQWEGIKETVAQLFMGPQAAQAVQIFGSANAARAVSEEARRDSYTLAALAWAYYNLGHNVKPGPNAKKEKLRALLRCCDLLDKSLAEDPRCAFALQGLAILAAEGTLIDLVAPNGIASAQEAEARRRRGAEDAINMLTKLREINDDTSVSICMGHALMVKEDFERALSAYELAARKVAPAPPKPSLLQYLAKASYHRGMQVKSYTHLKQSNTYLEEALHLLLQRGNSGASAEARFVRYNIAVTQQKTLQMLFDLSLEERQSSDLREAVEGIQASQQTFRELLPDAQAGKLSYISADIVEQRILYGDSSLLRQSVKHVEEQTAYEERSRAERENVAARKRERQEALDREREQQEESRRAAAEAIEAERKRAIEETRAWEYIAAEEEKPRKERVKKAGGRGSGKSKRSKKRKTDEGGSEIESSDSDRDAGARSDNDDNMIASDNSDVEQGDLSEEEILGRAPGSDEDEEGASAGQGAANGANRRSDKKKKLRRADSGAKRGRSGKKEKRARKSRVAAGSDDEDGGAAASRGAGDSGGSGDDDEDSRPAKKSKKGRMRRAKDEDLIESDEEL